VIVIVVRHRVRYEHADDFPRLAGDFTAATRAEPGTISLEWSRSTDDPAVYFLVEAFRDAAVGEAHVSSGHFKTAIAQMPGLGAEPPGSSVPMSPPAGGRGWRNCRRRASEEGDACEPWDDGSLSCPFRWGRR
jgi:quinol monooxygenase YgiN